MPLGTPAKSSNPPTNSCNQLGFLQGPTSTLIHSYWQAYLLSFGRVCMSVSPLRVIHMEHIEAVAPPPPIFETGGIKGVSRHITRHPSRYRKA